MDKEVRTRKGLTVALVALVVIIILLGIAVTFKMFIAEPIADGSDCAQLSDRYEQGACMERLINEGDDEAAEEAYHKVLDKAWEDEDYYSYINLISDRAGLLSLRNRCEEAMKLYDDERALSLTAEELVDYYAFAIDTAIDCEDEELEKEFTTKRDAVVMDYDVEAVRDVEDDYEPSEMENWGEEEEIIEGEEE